LNAKTIILVIAGGFIAYNIIIVAYALSTFPTSEGIKSVIQRKNFINSYAPWLFISKSFATWLLTA